MTGTRTTIEVFLKKNGYNVTKARQIVFDALAASEPVTTNELIKKVSPKVNRASVYRTIELFEKLGIATRLQIGWKHKIELSDLFHNHHHHLTCLKCGDVIDVAEDFVLENEIARLSYVHKFKAVDHQLEIRGFCKNCQQK
jgi:Fur family ferric uptake transcriptional regulator